MSKEIELGLDRAEEMCRIAKALSSETRLEIIKLLNANSMNINEISEKLGMPPSTAALNIKVLEVSGIIHTELHPGVRGSMKLCSLKRDHISFTINSAIHSDYMTEIIDMPIGNYVECKVAPTCGLVNDHIFIGSEDEPRSFYNPERTSAQLIWFHEGFLVYHFSNESIIDQHMKSMELSMEICSEAPNFKNDWPSDITVWINGYECATWTSPGDFGGRRGKLNPPFWSDGSTQYGKLKRFKANKTGFYIDDERVSDITVDDLNLCEGHYIDVRIGVKEKAKNLAGMNLFGEKFGDYNQNILLRLDYN